jgi:hypothetical protein
MLTALFCIHQHGRAAKHDSGQVGVYELALYISQQLHVASCLRAFNLELIDRVVVLLTGGKKAVELTRYGPSPLKKKRKEGLEACVWLQLYIHNSRWKYRWLALSVLKLGDYP